MELTFVDFEITKSEEQPDGSLLVWGPATNDDIDSDRQIIDADFASRGLSKWLATGANVREMHQPKAIGLGVELVRDGNAHMLRSRIVEPTAVKLTKEKVLRAYSVGISNAKIDYTKNPKARGGTIVDGEFVEVSLVDRPANAACKVDIVKAASDGTAVWTDIITKAAEVETGSQPEIVKVCADDADCDLCKTTVEKGKLTAEQRSGLDDGDFAYIDSSGGRHLPVHDEGHVRAALGRFSQTTFESDAAKRKAAKKVLSRAKTLGVDVSPDSDVAQAAKIAKQAPTPEPSTQAGEPAEPAEIPYTVKRLHDHLCPAYTAMVVTDEYPTCQTVHDALDVGYWAKAVSTALTEDNGTGQFAATIADLSAVYGAAVQVAHADPAAVADAAESLRKAFSDMYPSVTLTPQQIMPGQFRRPFIRPGHAGLRPSGKPRIPTQAQVPDADDFGRGYIGDGRQAKPPAAGAPNSPNASAKGRQFYTNNARDQASLAMTTMHDYIAANYPAVCSMTPMAAQPEPVDPANRVPNRADAKPTPIPGYTKTLTLEDGEVDTAALQKMIAETAKAAAAKATKRLAKKHSKLLKKYQKSEAARRELETAADPSAMAYRGGMIGPTVTKTATTPEDPDVVAKREQVAWLKSQVRHPDPTVARPAVEKLQSMVTPDELADILTS